MITGIGTDITDINRIKKAILKDSFVKKVFTDNEKLRVLDCAQTAAGVFAAKEAFVKACGTGFGKIKATDIEVMKDESGKPYFIFYNEAKSFVEDKNARAHLSISHEKDYAVAFVLIEGEID
ncbi:MAG: holo-ACP synthase [Firmicutes bacterium]|nr:holo-ACP synthase [Bacillota bacterium]